MEDEIETLIRSILSDGNIVLEADIEQLLALLVNYENAKEQ